MNKRCYLFDNEFGTWQYIDVRCNKCNLDWLKCHEDMRKCRRCKFYYHEDSFSSNKTIVCKECLFLYNNIYKLLNFLYSRL